MADQSTAAIPWRSTLDEALQEGRQQHKPVLLDFFSPT